MNYEDMTKRTQIGRLLMLLAGITLLVGCTTTSRVMDRVPVVGRLVGEDGYLRDRSGEYVLAETIPDTRIPEELDSFVIDDLYVIPDYSGQEAIPLQNLPRPRPMEGNNERGVVVQSMNSESWIVAGASPSQIWPRLQDYWLSKQIPLTLENATAGLMETTWFEMGEDSQSREKLRLSIINGFQDNSSEIRLSHVSVANNLPLPVQPNFPEFTLLTELSTEMLEDISFYLADVADIYQAASVSFLAENISSDGRADLNTLSDGTVQLQLQADYRRGWGAVGLALNRAPGVEVISSDQDNGIYDITYIVRDNPDDKPGFLGGLFSKKEPVYNMRLQVLPTGDLVVVEAIELSVDRRPKEDVNAENSLIQLIRRIIT